ncbi:hypothetical protein D3C78_1845850 [compost metagenome]
MLPDRRKKRLEQLGIRTHDQPRIRLQFQHIQQLLRLTMQGNRLQMLVGLQHVMKRHAITTQRLDRRRATGHKNGVERH